MRRSGMQVANQPRRSSKRPIDKQIINVAGTITSASQTNVSLYTATYPCTVTGVRWQLSLINIVASICSGKWMIYIVRDGYAANSMSATNGGSLYTPEEDVLAWGSYIMPSTGIGASVRQEFIGETKSMRKLQGGDVIGFSCICSDVDGAQLDGSVQFFLKG
jgi:hypothetical protein